jgi:predicted NUDIX family NTP pyrophosphohydrolase
VARTGRRRTPAPGPSPRGWLTPGEEPLAAARREFAEETGSPPPDGSAVSLGEFQQNAGKTVAAFAVGGDFDTARITSNTFTMEWPPKSGRAGTFPEVDRAAWFTLAEAAKKIVTGQRPILAALAKHLDGG